MPKIDTLFMTKHGLTLYLAPLFEKNLQTTVRAVLQEKGLNYIYLARNDR